MAEDKCPVCREKLAKLPDAATTLTVKYNCSNCGSYGLTSSMIAVLDDPAVTPRQRAVLSHAIRRMQRDGEVPTIKTDLAAQIWRDDRLPTMPEQLDNLILYLGTNLSEPGAKLDLHAERMRAVLGSITADAAGWLLVTAEGKGLIQGVVRTNLDGPTNISKATLLPAGWKRFEELQNRSPDSRRAFMAMQFCDQELDLLFYGHFKPAAQRAGFDLSRLDEEPRAGLIDDRLRLEIRRSRFLIADLTHGNPGAYWEAGFAEGLGRPVIYTCRRDVFDDLHKRPHFDTNHYLTVIWDAVDPTKAAAQLTTTIRVTLPSEAKLTDD